MVWRLFCSVCFLHKSFNGYLCPESGDATFVITAQGGDEGNSEGRTLIGPPSSLVIFLAERYISSIVFS